MHYSYLDDLALYRVEGAHRGGFDLTTNILLNEYFNPSTRILDAGCGIGKTSYFLCTNFQMPSICH